MSKYIQTMYALFGCESEYYTLKDLIRNFDIDKWYKYDKNVDNIEEERVAKLYAECLKYKPIPVMKLLLFRFVPYISYEEYCNELAPLKGLHDELIKWRYTWNMNKIIPLVKYGFRSFYLLSSDVMEQLVKHYDLEGNVEFFRNPIEIKYLSNVLPAHLKEYLSSVHNDTLPNWVFEKYPSAITNWTESVYVNFDRYVRETGTICNLNLFQAI